MSQLCYNKKTKWSIANLNLIILYNINTHRCNYLFLYKWLKDQLNKWNQLQTVQDAFYI